MELIWTVEHHLGGTGEPQPRAAAALTSLELSNSLGVQLFFPDLIYVCEQGLGWETDKLSLALSLLAFAGDVELKRSRISSVPEAGQTEWANRKLRGLQSWGSRVQVGGSMEWLQTPGVPRG